MAIKIQLRRGTAAEWTAANPVLADGEPGLETDTGIMKIGNGVTAWNSLTSIQVSAHDHDVGDLVQIFQNGLV
jgi:hypothetical protein